MELNMDDMPRKTLVTVAVLCKPMCSYNELKNAPCTVLMESEQFKGPLNTIYGS